MPPPGDNPPFEWQTPQSEGDAPDEVNYVGPPGFSNELLLEQLKDAIRRFYRCSVTHRCLSADMVDGLHATQIVTVLDIAGLTSATPASGDLFIFADISDSDAVRKATLAVINAALDHGTLAGLGDDDHSIYALLLGRAGGQEIIGGTASGNNLRLQSTSHATRGSVISEDVLVSEKGRVLAVVATSGALQITSVHDVVQVTGAHTVTLEASPTVGRRLVIINDHSAAITVDGNGVTINAAATISVAAGARLELNLIDPTDWNANLSSREAVSNAVTAANTFGTDEIPLVADGTGRGAKALTNAHTALEFLKDHRAVKTSNTDVLDTTYADTGLITPTLLSGKRYSFKAYLRYDITSSDADNGVKLRSVHSSSISELLTIVKITTTGTAGQDVLQAAGGGLSSGLNITTATSESGVIIIEGVLVPSADATFKLQHAMVSGTAGGGKGDTGARIASESYIEAKLLESV